MKRYQKGALCIAFSVIVQCGVLWYVDKVLLKESDDFKIETVEVPVKTFDTNIEIPSTAQDVQISYSGKYITYKNDSKFMLVNTSNSETKEILADTEILDCKWVPKNNTLYIVENKDNSINLKTYNVDSDIEQDINELCQYNEGMDIKSYISHSEQYIGVCYKGKTTIYRVDIEKEVNKLKNKINKLNSADVFWNEDIFIYQDSETKKLYKYTCGQNSQTSEILVSNPSKTVILKAADDIIFLGEYSENGKISKIIFGKDTQNVSSWKIQNLEKPRDVKDIYITDKNEIIINDNDENKVTNINNGNSMSYKGKFVAINDRVLLSIDEGKISLKSVKETL